MKLLAKPVFRALLLLVFLITTFTSLAQERLSAEHKTILQNWAYFQDQQEYSKAVEQAKQIFKLGEDISNNLLMAEALNRHGRSLLSMPKNKKRNRKEARKNLEKSLFYLSDIDNQELRLSNLSELLKIANLGNDQNLAGSYKLQIDKIHQLINASSTNAMLTETKEVLEEQVDSLVVVKNTLAIQKIELDQRVETLTESQLQSELKIAIQENEMVSMLFERTKDSFLLEQKAMLVNEKDAQLQLQKNQIELQSSQRNFFLALAGIIGLLAIGTTFRFRETKKHNIQLETKNRIIQEEKERSEELLLNILPAVVAKELKLTGKAKAKKYENATVLFTDFKNFSGISERLSPEELINELDFYFKTFDFIIDKYNLEKIKTIGDAYMCVGGLPEERPNHPEDVVRAALEIQSCLNAWKIENLEKNEPCFEARIGIHTGPLIAGVVGSRKFAYDIWGDTVNVAARLESKSEAGKVNISAATFELVKNQFSCEHRGKIPVKNKGQVEMYFVNGVL